MKVKSLVKLSLSILVVSGIMTGCGKLKQPEINKSFSFDKNNSTYKEQSNLLKAMIGEKGYMSDEVGYQFIPYRRGYKGVPIDVTALLRANFYIKNNSIFIEDNSSCYKKECKFITNIQGINNFYNSVRDKQYFLESNFTKYLDEYSLKKDVINSWLVKVKNTKLNRKLKNTLGLNNKILNGLSENTNLTYVDKTNERIFVEFKNSSESDLNKFLNNYKILKYNSGNSLHFKRFMARGYYNHEKYISILSNNKGIVDTIDFYFNYIPSSFKVKNKYIDLDIKSNKYGSLTAIVSNKTNQFIDLTSISTYYDGSIITLPLKIKLPPKANTLESDIRIKIPSDKKDYLKINKKNQKVNYGYALEYIKDGKKANIYKTKDYSISSF